ncbi:hypothetical protein EDB85DRAFT_1903917 [Lactarius pseudohatsudake]|nr:hypothetical protein EDB85DRAFT_1903917 [Lactarius pseudohatsudake]
MASETRKGSFGWSKAWMVMQEEMRAAAHSTSFARTAGSAGGFTSGKPYATIPWAKLSTTPTTWIQEECYPPGFKWADPSKIRLNDVHDLLIYWKQRKEEMDWLPSSGIHHCRGVLLDLILKVWNRQELALHDLWSVHLYHNTPPEHNQTRNKHQVRAWHSLKWTMGGVASKSGHVPKNQPAQPHSLGKRQIKVTPKARNMDTGRGSERIGPNYLGRNS